MINSLAAAFFWLSSSTADIHAWQLVQTAVICSSYLETAQGLGIGNRVVTTNSQHLMQNFLNSLPPVLQQIAAANKRELQQQISVQMQIDPANTTSQIQEVVELCSQGSSQLSELEQP